MNERFRSNVCTMCSKALEEVVDELNFNETKRLSNKTKMI